jgi:hypothetical protein
MSCPSLKISRRSGMAASKTTTPCFGLYSLKPAYFVLTRPQSLGKANKSWLGAAELRRDKHAQYWHFRRGTYCAAGDYRAR